MNGETLVRFRFGPERRPSDLVPIAKALLTQPEVIEGLGEEFEKAIKPGSRTAGKLSAGQLVAVRRAEWGRAEQAADYFRGRIKAHIEDWRDVVELFDDGKVDRTYLEVRKTRTLHRVRTDIREYYGNLFEHGKRAAENMRPFTPEDDRLLTKLRRDEYLYLRNFMQDIEEHRGVMDYERRAELYGNAATEAAWMGFVAGDLSHDRLIRWRMHEEAGQGGEACVDCLRLSGKRKDRPGDGGQRGDGVYSAHELIQLGVYPASGKLACTTRCRCELVPFTGKRKRQLISALPRWETAKPKEGIRPRLEKQKSRHRHTWPGRKVKKSFWGFRWPFLARIEKQEP